MIYIYISRIKLILCVEEEFLTFTEIIPRRERFFFEIFFFKAFQKKFLNAELIPSFLRELYLFGKIQDEF